MRQQGAWLWTKRQRATLAVIVLILAVAFLVRALRNPARVADPPPVAGDRANGLATRIDPNTADWPAWAALPLIGEKRAKEIVAFRENWLADHPGEVPFEKPEDLMRVKGIGKATVTALEPYLTFPKRDDAATQP
jgi:DNA uptake protein ComE-like DNA-binding protein